MRVLQSAEAAGLLKYFPQTRLSYEVNIHKKDETYNDECFIIPKGRKCVAWATEWNRQKIIAIIEIAPTVNRGANSQRYNNNNNQKYPQQHTQSTGQDSLYYFNQANGWTPGQVTIYDVCFHGSLSYGSVFSGTLFKATKNQRQIPCFCIQNIYWYKGEQVSTIRYNDYVRLCEQLFGEDNIRQVSYTTNGIIFGLPVMCANEQSVEEVVTSLPYNVYSIHFRTNNMHSARVHQKVLLMNDKQPEIIHQASTTKHIISERGQQQEQRTPTSTIISKIPVISPKIPFVKPNDDMLTNIQAVFIVRPNIQNDIYELFVKPTNRLSISQSSSQSCIFHNFAHIPNYKTSAMMNALFRKIKENDRLDTMEESDDDDEFENIEQDKFVSLTTEYKMVCRLNKKFCKWVPISVVSQGTSATQDVITDINIKQHELRYLPKKYTKR
jgi:hypothetical protein